MLLMHPDVKKKGKNLWVVPHSSPTSCMDYLFPSEEKTDMSKLPVCEVAILQSQESDQKDGLDRV